MEEKGREGVGVMLYVLCCVLYVVSMLLRGW